MSDTRFDKSWAVRCDIRKCSIAAVGQFIARHYLGKPPAVVLLCLVMTCDTEPVGCIVYAAPPRETETRYGGKTWELDRLFIEDSVSANAETWLIAQSIRYIKKNIPGVRFLVSYADPSAGHSGTIYTAANWTRDGRTDEGRKTPRSDYVDADTGQKYGRKSHIPDGARIERIPRISKARFVYTLQRGKRKRRPARVATSLWDTKQQ